MKMQIERKLFILAFIVTVIIYSIINEIIDPRSRDLVHVICPSIVTLKDKISQKSYYTTFYMVLTL